MTPIFSIRLKSTPKPQKGRWTRFHRERVPWLSSRLVELLLSESRADRDDRLSYAQPMASWILRHPELAARLQPDKGKFHRQIIACIQASPKLTPEIRGRLATSPHILPYLI